MNNHRVAAVATAASLMMFAASLVAEETVEIKPDALSPALNVSEQEITLQYPAPEIISSEQEDGRPAEKFLTEFKIYPAF